MSHNLRRVAGVLCALVFPPLIRRTELWRFFVIGVLLAAAGIHSLHAQSIATIVDPANGVRFQKAVGMELNIQLRATVTPPMQNLRVYFFANGGIVGSAHTTEGYATVWSNVSFGTYQLAASTAGGGPPPGPAVTIHVDPAGVALVNESAVWRYLDAGVDPGPGWFEPGFDTSSWLSGVPQFGFGDGDETTMVNFLSPNGSVYPTYYFKHWFVFTNAGPVSNAVVRLLRDDGAIVYLNGQEVIRDNMPAGVVSNGTYAVLGASNESEFTDWNINPQRLVEGTNHLAVEIHNQGAQSHDISFDLRFLINLPLPEPALRIARMGGDVALTWPRDYLGYHLEETDSLNTLEWRRNTNVFRAQTEFRSTNAATGASRFYRLRLE